MGSNARCCGKAYKQAVADGGLGKCWARLLKLNGARQPKQGCGKGGSAFTCVALADRTCQAPTDHPITPAQEQLTGCPPYAQSVLHTPQQPSVPFSTRTTAWSALCGDPSLI